MNKIKVSKTLAEGKFRYIGLNGFENDEEWNKIFDEIVSLLERK